MSVNFDLTSISEKNYVAIELECLAILYPKSISKGDKDNLRRKCQVRLWSALFQKSKARTVYIYTAGQNVHVVYINTVLQMMQSL